MKNIRIVHGTLMYPLEVGSRALIFEEGRYLHTSKVIAIHGVTPQQIRFETMNSHYPAKTLREMCNSYGWGFCRGLSAAFQKQEAEHQEWGLVMVVPQAVEDAVSKMKRSSYKISSTSSMNRQYAAMGYADGQEFDMRRRLEPSA